MKIRTRLRRRSRATVITLVALAATVVPGPAAAGDQEAKVTVVHAIPDLTVDVYVNDGLLLEDFEPGTITEPLSLHPATYGIEITPANSGDVALSASVPVKDDTDATAIAYLNEEGVPTLGLFANNQRPIRSQRARVTVRHTAAAPEVDVRYKRHGGEWKLVTSELMSGEEATGGLKARKYRFDVVLAGTDQRVLGPAKLELDPRTHLYVYAWGSVEDDSLALNLSTRRLPSRD